MTRPTLEFHRVQALPRRTLTDAFARQCAAELTPLMRVRGSLAQLMPWQAAAVVEAVQNGGGILALPVGVGKTLATYLLPRAMGARRTMLVVPASARDKTIQDFAALFKDWGDIDTMLRIVSVQELAPESGESVLDEFRPDLIISDECHRLANRKSSAARRIDRYIVKHQDAVRFVGLTGTLSRKSILSYWHLLCWALRDRAPVPRNEGEAEAWAAALDMTSGAWAGAADPGVLGRTQDHARSWYRSRLLETPGVVVVDVDSAGAVPLTLRWRVGKPCPEMDTVFERFLVEQENPAGIPVTDGLSRWRLDAQAGCGLYLRYRYPPPPPWVVARRESARFVRDTIEESTHWARPLDTEAQVFRRFPTAQEVQNWKRVGPTFEPETEAVWFSSAAVEDALAWLRESPTPGVIWCGGVEFARAVATAAGLSYYGAEGKDQNGRFLNRAPPNRSLVASWNACGTGFNLQAWRRAIVFQFPQSSRDLEQLIGRHHRQGQKEPIVVDFYVSSGGSADAFEMAVREAETVKAREGLTQKILRARIVRAELPRGGASEFRWARRTRTPVEPIAVKGLAPYRPRAKVP